MTAQTQQAIRAINLEEVAPSARRIFIASRDDLRDRERLKDQWSASGLPVEQRQLPGFLNMLASPHNTRVPDEALSAIVAWLTEGGASPALRAPIGRTSSSAGRTASGLEVAATSAIDGVRESVVRFGSSLDIWGVLTEPADGASRSSPLIVISNAGSTHHVGPARLYVTLARTLARAELSSLRLDLPGLGDSVIQDSSRENDSYPPDSSTTIATAIDALTQTLGSTAYVVLGLCSGAHTAFHAALDLRDRPIVEAVLLNPRTFYYTPGMPLDDPSPMPTRPWQQSMEAIRQRLRRSRLARTTVKTALHTGRRLRRARFGNGSESDLERDLAQLASRGRKVTFVFSKFDPGYSLLMADAGRSMKRSLGRGEVSLWSIKHANHTFTGITPRAEVIQSLGSYLKGRYVGKPSKLGGRPLASIRPVHSTSTVGQTFTRVKPDRVRLLTFVTDFGCGGTERQFINLGKALNRQRFALEYGCIRIRGELLNDVTAGETLLREYPAGRLWGLGAVRQQLRLARYLRRRRIQILHSYNFYSNVFAIPAAWLAGVPVIVASIRDRGVYLTTAQRHVQRWICRLADCVLVNAESIKEWLADDGYDPSNIVVIRNGVDFSPFDHPGTTDIRRELNIPADAPIVTMVARLNSKKGVDDFIQAAAMVTGDRPDARYLIVGQAYVSSRGSMSEDIAYRQTLIDEAARMGLQDKLHLIGYRSDVPALLSETAVSVLPSHSEGLSNTLLESMAAGVPVVATRVGGTPEVVDHGATGLLVPPSDPHALAEALRRLLIDRDLAARLGAAGYRSVRERFAMDRMVSATEAVYVDLLARHAAAPGVGLPRPVIPERNREDPASLESDAEAKIPSDAVSCKGL
jgi:glycosyltransferase involved in cell wall biosynthesis/pimeloyl-ACP methyl ester carboxylesterase